jgi:hypothetical protein
MRASAEPLLARNYLPFGHPIKGGRASFLTRRWTALDRVPASGKRSRKAKQFSPGVFIAGVILPEIEETGRFW